MIWNNQRLLHLEVLPNNSLDRPGQSGPDSGAILALASRAAQFDAVGPPMGLHNPLVKKRKLYV
jgi:hypothetical protein